MTPSPWLVQDLAILAPILEFATGVGLLFQRSRKVALFAAIAMHILILMVLGPFGRQFNPVIWPWNLAMIAFGLLPALSLFNLWDDYLSSAMYTGNINDGGIYLSDDAFEQLPAAIQKYALEEGPNLSSLTINDWSFDELNVPSYPQEVRIYQNVARRVCSYVSKSSGVELVIQRKSALIDNIRRDTYRCSDLD